MPAAAAAKVRQKSRRRSKSQGRGSERKPNLSVPLPPGGGLPFVLAEQASTLLGEAADFFFGEASKGAGASTATPDPSVSSSVRTEEGPFVAGETSSRGTFPRNETERRVFDRCRDTYLSRGLPLPHDMLFGFVRTNSKEYTAADEDRWGDSALALLDEALQLFHEAKVDRNVQKLLPADEETRRARAIFDECWPYVELGQDRTGHWTVLDRLGIADFDRLHRELGNNKARFRPSVYSLSLALALALAHAPTIDTPSHAFLALALYQVLQCYAQRMERVRQSKLKLAKAIGTAGYYHTTVIDMRGLNAAFLKHRAMVQWASMRRRPSWRGAGGAGWGGVGWGTSPRPAQRGVTGCAWPSTLQGRRRAGFGRSQRRLGGGGAGGGGGQPRVASLAGGPFASRRRATPRPSSESISSTAPRHLPLDANGARLPNRVRALLLPRTASLRARTRGCPPPRSAASAT